MPSSLVSIAIIPARLESTRFPGKILHPILDRPMVQWVYENVSKAQGLSEVWVATDHAAIQAKVQEFGGKAVLTPKGFESGTDRVAWVAGQRAQSGAPADIIVNVQGDEPLLPPTAIERLIAALAENPSWQIATLAVPLEPEAARSPNVVKVLTSLSGRAIYFSRTPFPTERPLKHIGIYAFRREALIRFSQLPQSPLERSERLEQLRAMENDMSIGVVTLEEDTIAVDVPEDVAKVEERMMQGRFHFRKS